MVTVDLKGVNTVRKKLADGSTRLYFYHRSSGKRLDGVPGSTAFLGAYHDAERVMPRDIGTVAGLIREYRASPKFAKKRDSTQREYKRMLTHLETKFGTMPVVALGSPRVIGKFIDYQEEVGRDRPREADNRLTIMSAVFSYAKSKGRIGRNPLEGFERLYAGDRAEKIWTEAEIIPFMKGCPVELQRAMILAIHTGQRYGDLVRLRWSDYDGDAISLKQSKTSMRVWIKSTAALKLMLDTTPRVGPYILTRPDGRPWHTEKDDKALAKAWTQRMKDAELYCTDPSKRLHFNDLRGTAVTLLAEANASIPQIVSITGHTLESATRILERYLARTKRLSEAAILLFENAPATAFANRLQTTPEAQLVSVQKQ
ncbi:tyrosine-type recombinase/integrase [Devosia naphthalenivorans]|uniref:tyrosine-type recombinase/integrase n=1 Tax=Devosia naphthalenivorans TaxID=2082392 RepID=UPI000D371DBB|nr:tyrosine-type recombinase/integrase [Devosia naphthalenivorans]